ncbi:MAG: hypothetical protein ABS897_10830, partial [Eubacteriales bacterium]
LLLGFFFPSAPKQIVSVVRMRVQPVFTKVSGILQEIEIKHMRRTSLRCIFTVFQYIIPARKPGVPPPPEKRRSFKNIVFSDV